MKTSLKHIVILLLGIVVINYLGNLFFIRIDLTEDKRYTLNEATKNIIKDVDAPIIVDIFLKGEGFPSEIKRLQSETRQLLEEFEAYNSNIKFSFINPLEDDNSKDRNIQQLTARGLTPMQVKVQQRGKTSTEMAFPWGLASYNGATTKVQLIKNKIGTTQQDLVSNSVQHLEYAFADAFSKLVYPKRKKIAILKGNGQLHDQNIFDFVTTLKDYYFIAPFTLDSVSNNANKTLKALNEFDLVISAKPTEAFNEKEKLVLDQFTMNGGKSLWLVDAVAMERDSLLNTGQSIAIARELNLTDFFFKYGVRINPVLINDLYSEPITLAAGEGSQAQFQQAPWFYSPVVNNEVNHPITNNLNLVKLDFANQIDTLKNNIKKTILLKSSILSKTEGTPKVISLDIINTEPDPKTYTNNFQPLAVLLEGEFTSVYNNRIKPFDLEVDKNTSSQTKMIVIADGDVIKNDVGRNGPLELGFNRFTGELYGNKEFLLNCVNYLLDDTGLINIRSKDVKLVFLDLQKVSEEKTKWQLINIAVPLIILLLFGLLFNYFRKQKYTRI